MIKQLAHACIHAGDLEKTAEFYCNVLGCESGFDFIRNGQRFGFYIKLGNGTFIEVFERDAISGQGSIAHLALEVDDMDAMIARVKSHGYDIGDKKMGADHSWQVWLQDPNGVRIELHEYTPESCQLVGGTCHLD
jgi:catechol 2,3-dioxygenase-like lactoylglutathione lyase family enzyme